MRVYYLIGRILSPFAFIGLRAYSLVARTKRARLIVQNESGELLLVQSWLGGGKWGMPGGGLDKGESPEEAALRELREETGIVADPNSLEYVTTMHADNHEELIYRITIAKSALPASTPSSLEIADAAWFAPNNLPRLGSLAQRIVQEVAIK